MTVKFYIKWIRKWRVILYSIPLKEDAKYNRALAILIKLEREFKEVMKTIRAKDYVHLRAH